MIHSKRLNSKSINRQADVFRALASPARLVVLLTLLEGERSVNELVDVLADLQCACSAERTNLSKHLAALRQVGLVDFREDAQRRLYFLTDLALIQEILEAPAWRRSTLENPSSGLACQPSDDRACRT